MPFLDDLEYLSLMSGPTGNNIVPVDQNGQWAVRAMALCGGDERTVVFQYDEQLRGFTTINGPANKDSLWVDSPIAWWKDTFYGYEPSMEGSSSHVSLTLLGTRYVLDLTLIIPFQDVFSKNETLFTTFRHSHSYLVSIAAAIYNSLLLSDTLTNPTQQQP